MDIIFGTLNGNIKLYKGIDGSNTFETELLIYSEYSYGFFGSILVSLFQSVTTRTAGFNTTDLSFMHNSTLFLLIILMFIGASPGGTAGGVKTTVATSVAAAVYSYIRGEDKVVLFNRRIPDEAIYRSLVIVILSFFILSLAAFVLSDIESVDFLSALFESVSALSTVGWSV